MLLVSRSFQVLRRRARVIRVFSAFLALLLTPVALILFAILFLGLGFPDATPGEILRDTWRWIFGFFVRLFSGHALRPFSPLTKHCGQRLLPNGTRRRASLQPEF